MIKCRLKPNLSVVYLHLSMLNSWIDIDYLICLVVVVVLYGFVSYKWINGSISIFPIFDILIRYIKREIYHFVTWNKLGIASQDSGVMAYQEFYSNREWKWDIYLPAPGCKFFHLQYKDCYKNSWRIQQCLYMKLNCGNRVQRCCTHQYLYASKEKKLWSSF